MTLENITFAEFLMLDADASFPYIFAFQHGATLVKPVNHFELKAIDDYTFGQVKDGIYNLENGLMMQDLPEFISIFSKDEPQTYMNVGVVEVLQTFSYIKKGLEQISEVERQMLVSPISQKELAAGLEKFNQYGVYPQMETLALRFGKTVKWVRKQPYNDMFLSMCYNKTLQDYQMSYANLK